MRASEGQTMAHPRGVQFPITDDDFRRRTRAPGLAQPTTIAPDAFSVDAKRLARRRLGACYLPACELAGQFESGRDFFADHPFQLPARGGTTSHHPQ